MIGLFKRKQADPKEELKALLGDYELPRFPTVVMDVLAMLRDPHSDTADIADKMQMDLDMSVKALRLINSAAFGLTTQVSNLYHAVTIMGRSRLESMLLTYAVASSMPQELGCMDITRYWKASARRACLAKHIAQQLHAASQADSFTAALLQDLAIPFMYQRNGEAYTRLLEEWHANPAVDLVELEREAFGYDHSAIGGLVAEDWGLSEYLVDAVAGHHDLSEESTAQPAVRFVSLIRYEEEDEEGLERLVHTATEDFGVSRDLMDEMVPTAFEEAEAFAKTIH